VGNETRYRMVQQMDPERFRQLMERAEQVVKERWAMHEWLAQFKPPVAEKAELEPAAQK
jgi:pyruvate-ferredoxin/flavodoxin oxidoreductase